MKITVSKSIRFEWQQCNQLRNNKCTCARKWDNIQAYRLLYLLPVRMVYVCCKKYEFVLFYQSGIVARAHNCEHSVNCDSQSWARCRRRRRRAVRTISVNHIAERWMVVRGGGGIYVDVVPNGKSVRWAMQQRASHVSSQNIFTMFAIRSYPPQDNRTCVRCDERQKYDNSLDFIYLCTFFSFIFVAVSLFVLVAHAPSIQFSNRGMKIKNKWFELARVNAKKWYRDGKWNGRGMRGWEEQNEKCEVVHVLCGVWDANWNMKNMKNIIIYKYS